MSAAAPAHDLPVDAAARARAQEAHAASQEEKKYVRPGPAPYVKPMTSVTCPSPYALVARLARELVFPGGGYETEFDLVVMSCIIVAGFSVGIHLYPATETMLWLIIVDTFVLGVFIVEILIKIVANEGAPWLFFIGRDWGWNNFDTFLVVMSLPGMEVEGAMALRLLRLVRMQKMAKKMPQVMVIMEGFAAAITSSAYIMLLLAIVFYVFAVAGWYFFALNDPWHFRNVPISLVSLFRAATLEDWTDIMYINIYGCKAFQGGIYISKDRPEYATTEGLYKCNYPRPKPIIATTYWVLFVLVTGLVALSLFVGAVTVSMAEKMDEMKDRKAEESRLNRDKMALQRINAKYLDPETANKKDKAYLIKAKKESEALQKILQKALRIPGYDRGIVTYAATPAGHFEKLADFMAVFTEGPIFTNVITVFICIAAVLVGMETDKEIMNDKITVTIMKLLDAVVLAVFVVEVVLKVVAQKYAPLDYFNENWNRFDFFIVVMSFVPTAGPIKVLRLLRLFRLLKMIRNFPELAVMVSALIVGMSSMWFIGVMLVLVFYLFGILGVMLFAKNDPAHFGRLHNAMLSLFRIATGEDWTDIMYINIYGCAHYITYEDDDAATISEDCKHSQAFDGGAAVFFIVFFIIGSLVMLNLFVGVITTAMDEASVSQKEEGQMAKAIQVYAHQEGIEDDILEDFNLAFSKIDVAGEGDICTAELMDCLVVMRVTEDKSEIEAWLEMADSDKSGYIDLFEFIKFMNMMLQKIQAESKNLADPTKADRLDQIRQRIADERMARVIAETGLHATHKTVARVSSLLKELSFILNLPLEKIARSESQNDAAFTGDLAELNERVLHANAQLGTVDQVVADKEEKAAGAAPRKTRSPKAKGGGSAGGAEAGSKRK